MKKGTLYKLCEDDYWHDLSHWPKPAALELQGNKLAVYELRRKAIHMWFANQSLDSIRLAAGIPRSELYRFLERALTYRSENEIWGFGALVPGTHVKQYERTELSDSGSAGKWSQLMGSYPELEEFIFTNYIPPKRTGKIVIKAIDVSDIHERFVDLAKELGLGTNDYPLGNKDRGYDALLRYCKSLEEDDGARQAVHARRGLDLAKKYDATHPQTGGALKTQIVPYEQVEFDEHEIGLYMTVQCLTPEGIYVPLTISKCWVLILKDISSRVTLGYHLSLSEKYDRQDVLLCFVHSLTPWKRLEHDFPFEIYSPDGGFPSGVLDNCSWRLYDEVALDNCRTHLSKHTLERLIHVVETIPSMDGKGLPTKRPFIESFNNTFKRAFSDKLPSTTGTNPFDLRRRNPEQAAEEFDIRLEEIRVIIDATFANLNGSPKHSRLNGISPLETIRRFDKQLGLVPRYLHPEFREDNPLNWIRLSRKVRGGQSRGEHPYVSCLHANYKSPDLSAREDLARAHSEVIVEINFFKPQRARIYEVTGALIATAYAQGEWGCVPHTIQDRKTAYHLVKSGKMHKDPNKTLMANYRDFLERRSFEDRRVRKRLAKLTSNPLDKSSIPSLYPLVDSGEEEIFDDYDDFDFQYICD